MGKPDLTEIEAAEAALRGPPEEKKKKGRKAKDEVFVPVTDWAKIAPYFCMPFNMILKALDSEPMEEKQEVDFTEAYGKLLEKYAPAIGAWQEEIAVVTVTLAVFGPAVAKYQERKRLQREAGGDGRPTP